MGWEMLRNRALFIHRTLCFSKHVSTTLFYNCTLLLTVLSLLGIKLQIKEMKFREVE